MSLIRGVLLAGKFRRQHDLNDMSHDDQRNTLIVELSGRSSQDVPHFQAMDDDTLAAAGAVLVFQREAKLLSDDELKAMSDDQQRNNLIVEIDNQTRMGVPQLQGLKSMELVQLGLGKEQPGVNLTADRMSPIRGVLLAGKFRSQHELNNLTAADQRNTLIVEMAGHSSQSVGSYQALDDARLAGAGAVMVFLREASLRDDASLKTMTPDAQRNVLIVEMETQTHLEVSRLQSLSSLDLVRVGLGVDPVFPTIAPQRYAFRVDSVEVRKQKADNDHSDSDWLSIVTSVGNPVTKTVETFSTEPIHIEGNIKTGNVIVGDFVSDPFVADDSRLVTISYLVMNLGSSDAEAQFAEAVEVTNEVVGIVAPIAGTVIGFWLFGGQAGEGFKVGQEIAKAVDGAVETLSDVFDFLGVHIGPPNCNGEVLHDTLTYLPGDLSRVVNQSASREYTGTQEEDRRGGAPETKVSFTVIQPFQGFISPVQ